MRDALLIAAALLAGAVSIAATFRRVNRHARIRYGSWRAYAATWDQSPHPRPGYGGGQLDVPLPVVAAEPWPQGMGARQSGTLRDPDDETLTGMAPIRPRPYVGRARVLRRVGVLVAPARPYEEEWWEQ